MKRKTRKELDKDFDRGLFWLWFKVLALPILILILVWVFVGSNTQNGYDLKYECWLSDINYKTSGEKHFDSYEVYRIALDSIESKAYCEVIE